MENVLVAKYMYWMSETYFLLKRNPQKKKDATKKKTKKKT